MRREKKKNESDRGHTSWWMITLSGRIALRCFARVVLPEHVAPLGRENERGRERREKDRIPDTDQDDFGHDRREIKRYLSREQCTQYINWNYVIDQLRHLNLNSTQLFFLSTTCIALRSPVFLFS